MRTLLILTVLILAACSDLSPASQSAIRSFAEEIKANTVVVPGGTRLEETATVKTPQETIKIEEVPGQTVKSGDYSVKSNLSFMIDLAEVSNCVVKNKDFINEVANHKQFDFTNDSSAIVARNMSLYTPVVLTTYSKRFTKSIAYRNLGSNVLYLNTRKNPRNMREMVNTAIHERLHVVGYGHGSNSSAGKENSVPYGVGDMAEKYVEACNKTKTR